MVGGGLSGLGWDKVRVKGQGVVCLKADGNCQGEADCPGGVWEVLREFDVQSDQMQRQIIVFKSQLSSAENNLVTKSLKTFCLECEQELHEVKRINWISKKKRKEKAKQNQTPVKANQVLIISQ